MNSVVLDFWLDSLLVERRHDAPVRDAAAVIVDVLRIEVRHQEDRSDNPAKSRPNYDLSEPLSGKSRFVRDQFQFEAVRQLVAASVLAPLGKRITPDSPGGGEESHHVDNDRV